MSNKITIIDKYFETRDRLVVMISGLSIPIVSTICAELAQDLGFVTIKLAKFLEKDETTSKSSLNWEKINKEIDEQSNKTNKTTAIETTAETTDKTETTTETTTETATDETTDETTKTGVIICDSYIFPDAPVAINCHINISPTFEFYQELELIKQKREEHPFNEAELTDLRKKFNKYQTMKQKMKLDKAIEVSKISSEIGDEAFAAIIAFVKRTIYDL